MDYVSDHSGFSPESSAEPADEQSMAEERDQASPGSDYAGIGYSGQVPPEEPDAEEPAAEEPAAEDPAAGTPVASNSGADEAVVVESVVMGSEAGDETPAPPVSRTDSDESVDAVVESDVVVLATQDSPDLPIPVSEDSVAGPGAAAASARRWSEIKATFVDDPRTSVNLASGLVDQAIENLAAAVRSRYDRLGSSWKDADDETGTEQLRRALRAYRDLYERLEQVSGQFTAEPETATPAG